MNIMLFLRHLFFLCQKELISTFSDKRMRIQLIMPVFQPHRTSTTAPTTPASAAHPRRPTGSIDAASRNISANAERTPPIASVPFLFFLSIAT